MPADLPVTDEKPKEHRAGAWIVLILGLLGLGLGVYQWRGSFKTAFATQIGTFKTPAQIEQERVDAMKNKDTDGDTLTDFEETYVYKTSPYLDDSDSDGKKDQDELKSGSDPNCPEGKACAIASGSSSQTVAASSTSQIESDALKQLMNPTPEQIRAMLIQNGIKEEDLKNVDDATLMALYQQSLKEVQDGAQKNTNP